MVVTSNRISTAITVVSVNKTNIAIMVATSNRISTAIIVVSFNKTNIAIMVVTSNRISTAIIVVTFNRTSNAIKVVTFSRTSTSSDPEGHIFLSYPNLNNIRIYYEGMGRIEKFVQRITFWHHMARQVVTNGNPDGHIFLSCFYPILTQIMDSFSCSPLKFYLK